MGSAPAALPASEDLLEPWRDNNVQGATGSCVGWASAEGIVPYHLGKEGNIAPPEPLSARVTWIRSRETDPFTNDAETFSEEAGTKLKAAVDIPRQHGVVPEPALPFRINTIVDDGGGSTADRHGLLQPA